MAAPFRPAPCTTDAGARAPRRGTARRPLATVTLAAVLGLAPVLLPPHQAQAQTETQAQARSEAAMLVADRIWLAGNDRIVAEGNVEALQGDVRLSASKISFDQSTGELVIEGPIRLTQEGGETVIVADAARLDADLRNGLLTGARMMLSSQVQMAAAQITRSEERYSELVKATVSSCHVCDDGRPPLWQIRARRVTHDAEAGQIYFDAARFEVLGVPLLYLPHMRMPDPNQTRATGFLIPSIKRNSRLGTGLKLPYFWAIGESRDLLLTPYMSQNSRTLEFRYRQAFAEGALGISGAISSDELLPDEARGYIEAAGRFLLPRDLVLSFDIEAVADDGYLADYAYSSKDRLDSRLAVERARRDEWLSLSLTHYYSLRDDEDNSTLPSIIGDASYEMRHFPAMLGGELRLGTEWHHHHRYSDSDIDGPDTDSVTDGRDVTRLSASADWRRWYTLPAGLRAELVAGVALDAFRTGQDAGLPVNQTGVTPMGALTLSWPMLRQLPGGGTQVLEPVAQLAWSGGTALDVANDESTRLEFDEGNLLGLTRFTAPDRRERGWRGAYGVSFSHFDPSGWEGRLVLGQVVQEDPDPAFSESSGLSSQFSDLLIAGQISTDDGFSLSARGLFEGGIDPHKTEARAAWNNESVSLAASYVWLAGDLDEDRPNVISEWVVAGDYRWNDSWLTSANVRYDVADDRLAQAGFGVKWSNECVDVAFSVSKSFASSTVLSPSTDFSFTVGLRGFQASDGSKVSSKSCK
ncbi:LPS-assembly protein [Pseudooceanicola antarcticus]|uniref:LPS-assembly protein LptD n=2 Tax=Pseudooceanicola antarcticus TaxID=1247613 RepID=A0A285IWE0_9RHOB|nr:LPS assembly protein LptD [Pseudooceanicola antarcticus]SNY52360.1 LPS-assembly protein [Pseudooceanicola antarcticus]